MKDQFLTCAEAQDILRISRSKMYRLIHKKEIRAVKVGSTYRIPRAELDHYFDKEQTTDKSQEETV